jgi:hypothetical protein
MDGPAEEHPVARAEDEEEVEDDVDDVGQQVEEHRRARIARAAQQVRAHHQRAVEHIARGDDGQVRGGVRPDRRLRAHPAGQIAGNEHHQQRQQSAAAHRRQQGLHRDAARPLQLGGADGAAHEHGEAGGQPGEQAVDEPGGRGADGDRRRRGGADRADHGGVRVLNAGQQKLLDQRRPGEKPDRLQRMPVLGEQIDGLRHDSSSIRAQKIRARTSSIGQARSDFKRTL